MDCWAEGRGFKPPSWWNFFCLKCTPFQRIDVIWEVGFLKQVIFTTKTFLSLRYQCITIQGFLTVQGILTLQGFLTLQGILTERIYVLDTSLRWNVCVCEYMGGVWRVCKLVHLYENYWERKKEKLECQMTEKLHKTRYLRMWSQTTLSSCIVKWQHS